jgi:lysozyme
MAHPEISEAQGEYFLLREIAHVERAVSRLIRTPLNSAQFSALVSFTYNLGSGNLQRSTLRMMANRGDLIGAGEEFPKWRRAGGKILRGLIRRRAAERALWLS